MNWATLTQPTRSELAEALATGLPLGDEGLEILVRGVEGPAGPVDWIASDPSGAAVVLRFARAGDDLPALAMLLAERSWLAERLVEWRALHPTLPLRPGRDVRAVLLAPDFTPAARAAARSLGAPGVELVRVLAFSTAAGRHLALEPVAPVARPPLARSPEPELRPTVEPVGEPPPAARPEPEFPGTFRTGLRDEDLALPERPRSAPRARF